MLGIRFPENLWKYGNRPVDQAGVAGNALSLRRITWQACLGAEAGMKGGPWRGGRGGAGSPGAGSWRRSHRSPRWGREAYPPRAQGRSAAALRPSEGLRSGLLGEVRASGR